MKLITRSKRIPAAIFNTLIKSSAAVIIIFSLTFPVSAEETFTGTGEYNLSMKEEALEWGIYTSLFAGSFYLSNREPFFSRPLISGETDRDYKKKDTVPSAWLKIWMAGTYGFIALTPNSSGYCNRVTYNNIKGFYEAASYTAFLTSLTKTAAGRKRPSYDNYPEKEKNNDGRKSFISGHSSTAFLIASYSSLYAAYIPGNNSRTLHIILKGIFISTSFSAAAFTAWSRVDDNRHHWSDVIAGGTAGILSAGAGFYHQNFYSGNDSRGAFIILPMAAGEKLYLTASMKF